MTGTEWLKEEKNRIESDIKMHENRLNILRVQLDAVCSIIAQRDGQPEESEPAAMSRIRGLDREAAEIPKKYQVSSSFGHHLYENEHDAIQTVMMLGPYHGMEIPEGEVKAYLDMVGCYNAFPLVVQRCDY